MTTLLDENILLNEFAVEWLICKVLDTSERYQLNSVIMGQILTLLSSKAVLESNKTGNELMPKNAIELKRAFGNCTTVEINDDSVFMAIMHVSHNNFNFAKMIMHYVQYKCYIKDIRYLSMMDLMTEILQYKTWHYDLLKQVWLSQIINNRTVPSENLVDYISSAGSIQFNR